MKGRTLLWSGCALLGLGNSLQAQPSTKGEWGEPFSSSIQVIHAAVLKTGKVLYADAGTCTVWPNCNYTCNEGGCSNLRIYDPGTGTITTPALPVDSGGKGINVFCSGHCILSDGKVAFFGGGTDYDPDDTHDFAIKFDPDTSTWSLLDNMPPTGDTGFPYFDPKGRRYYGTAVPLGNGKVLVFSGGENNSPTDADAPIILDPSQPSGSQWTTVITTEADERLFPWYPFAVQVNDATVWALGSNDFRSLIECHASCDGDCTSTCDWMQHLQGRLRIGLGNWDPATLVIDDDPTQGQYDHIKGGAAVMHRPGVVMLAGGSLEEDGSSPGCDGDLITNRVRQFSTLTSPPSWSELAAMNKKRVNFTLTVLPDGKVLASGGDAGDVGGLADCSNIAYDAEMYDPATNTWTLMDFTCEPRMYHSSTVFLPDGRVLTGGGQCKLVDCAGGTLECGDVETECCGPNECTGPGQCSENDDHDPQYTFEIYSPPYLFGATRPAFATTPPMATEMVYSSNYTIYTSDASTITAVSLIRLSSSTHSLNTDQRYVPLEFTYNPALPNRLGVSGPAYPNLQPPGYYALYIVRNGIPSTGFILKLRA